MYSIVFVTVFRQIFQRIGLYKLKRVVFLRSNVNAGNIIKSRTVIAHCRTTCTTKQVE